MALQSFRSKGFVRLLVVALAIGMVATLGLVALPAVRGNFTGPGLALAPGKYTGPPNNLAANTYIPGETMQLTLTATPGDVINLVIQNGSGIPSYSRTGITMPASGAVTILFTIPSNWPDSDTYTARATDATSGQTRTRGFTVQQYALSVWTDHPAYLPGDTVTISWSAVLLQNGTPAPSGIGVLQVATVGGVNLLPTPQYSFSTSQGSYAFPLSSTVTTPDAADIMAWFNDTAGLRHATDVGGFEIGTLGVTVAVQYPTYAPGSIVSVTIRTRVAGVPGNPAEPNIPVVVNVTDLVTGNPVPAYSKSGLVTDANGNLNYVFQLASSPTTGSYDVAATATAHGTMSVTTSGHFNVQPTASLSVQVRLDKMQYMSGDTLTATAEAFATGAPTLTYTWTVYDGAGNRLATKAGGTTTFTFAIPTTYQGTLLVTVGVNDGNGNYATASVFTNVAFGYLALTLDKSQFSPGDTVTASFSLQSNVVTNPTYFWAVRDAGGTTVASGNTTSGSATYTTPSPAASSQYTFTVTASQNGRTVQAQATTTQVGGYFLAISLDKPNYMPGDAISITYTITARGKSVLPIQYRFYINLFGVAFKYMDTTSATGTLTLTIPQGAPTGNELLYVAESNTGASVYNVVHIGAVNPLLTEVAGLPLFDILIFLLFVVILLAVVLLWRRTGMGRAPPGVEGKPSAPAPPPPPPGGPGQQGQAAGPMSVACKHCGASIEITTSKRPIEVMCPSCGETQVVQ